MKKNGVFIRLLKDEKAIVTMEYALIVSLVSIVVITSMTNLGIQISDTFSKIASAIASTGAESQGN
jgi:Flp pilus assembly pilin Flp